MSRDRLLRRDQAVLVVVDIQEKLMKAIHESDQVIETSLRLIQAMKNLGAPVIGTLQIPSKLGGFSVPIEDALSGLPVFDKSSFSCGGCCEFVEKLELLGKRQVILCGVETHVCVNQTAHDLLDLGYQVHVVADAVSSRTPENKQIGIEKMRDSGSVITSFEAAVFELLQDAALPEFRSILPLVK